MSILDLLNTDLGKTLINGTSNQLGTSKVQATSALSSALPLILGAMKNNSEKKEGADGLLNALGNSRHDGRILTNLESILGGDQIDKDVLKDGKGILGHVFGGKEKNVARAISSKSGMNLSSAMDLLKVAGPVVMGFLGKQQRRNRVNTSKDIASLLGSFLSQESNEQGLVAKLLDADGDGTVLDDILGMTGGIHSKGNKGVGGMLGDIFGN